MRARRVVIPVICLIAAVALAAVVRAAQNHGRPNHWVQYEREMQDPIDDPPDANVEAEFAIGRLRFRSPLDRYRGRGTRWGTDANKGDRIFSAMMRRLTRIDVRSMDVGDSWEWADYRRIRRDYRRWGCAWASTT